MIISARNIPKYFCSLSFPIDVLGERDNSVQHRVHNQAELMYLVDAEVVFGVGTRTKLHRVRRFAGKKLKETEGERVVREGRESERRKNLGLGAEDNKTTRCIRVEGGRYFEHKWKPADHPYRRARG